MSEPKYAIGDTLRHVAEPRCKLFVVSVLTEQCPGGTQHHYHCRVIGQHEISRQLDKYNEVELTDRDDKATMRDLFTQVKELAVGLKEFKFAAAVREAEKVMEKENAS